MVVANEDLLMEMQRVSALMRRAHHKKMHRHGGPHGGPGLPPYGCGGPGMPPHGHDDPHGEPHGGPHGGPRHHGCERKGAGKHGQMRILAMLNMQDGISQKDLAFLLGIRPQSLTVALEKLEEAGFIERKQDIDDKRTRRVYITEEGKAQAETQAQERAQRADNVFAALSDEEKDQLAAILTKLNVALSEKQPEEPSE